MADLFPATARLRTRADFDRVFSGGRKYVNRQVVVYLHPADTPRLGLSVGRRVGDAVRRNRVKRCLREAFRRLAPTLDPPLEMIVIARPARPPTSLAEARAALDQVLRQAAR